MINENEIYSCGQLDFYNALSQSEKLKLQETSSKQQKQQQQPSSVKRLSPNKQQLSRVKLELGSQLLNDIQKSIGAKTVDATTESVVNELPELLFKRVAQKANPKTVTASVFKTIPAGAANKLLKPISGGNAFATGSAAFPLTSIGGARAPQSVTASLIQPIASIKRDLFGKSQAIDRAIIAEPSVVTASLFQPRTQAIGGTSTAFGITKLCNNNNNAANAAATITTANQLASRTEAMNKPFLMFTDDIRQLTSEYLDIPHMCWLHNCNHHQVPFVTFFHISFIHTFFTQKPFSNRWPAQVPVRTSCDRERRRRENAFRLPARAFAFALIRRDLVILLLQRFHLTYQSNRAQRPIECVLRHHFICFRLICISLMLRAYSILLTLRRRRQRCLPKLFSNSSRIDFDTLTSSSSFH